MPSTVASVFGSGVAVLRRWGRGVVAELGVIRRWKCCADGAAVVDGDVVVER